MIIIKIFGGMGNQMFQLALMYAIKKEGHDVKIDIGDLEKFLIKHEWSSAFKVFSINAEIASDEEVLLLADKRKDFWNLIRRRIWGKRSTYFLENKDGNYDEKIFLMDNKYLDGYWQSYKYFTKYRNDILKMYKFPEILTDENEKIKRKIIESKSSVSIHIRLGDYCQGKNNQIYGGICNEEYYNKAINYFLEKYPESIFFVFSNDKKYIKKLSGNKYVIVECNNEMTAWIDMYLMTLCNHNIIANSSFSWWGAWLNKHKDKKVVAPKKWINTKEMKDICPNDWVRL